MKQLRAYFRRRGGRKPPLLVIQKEATKNLSSLANEASLPVATVRGLLSFYSDLRKSSHRPLRCVGTSCLLAPSDEHQPDPNARPVYCLGFCDRSPGTLDREPPSIRSTARTAVVTKRIGHGDFSDFRKAVADGAYEALRWAHACKPMEVVDVMERSGERGRGGAGFPTGTKWRTCLETPSARKFVVANGDEGDPGSFIDRVLMEQDPHAILEGLAICAHAVGAEEGYVYIRSEYPEAIRRMEKSIEDATSAGTLGDFRVSVFPGMGSYVCGEETALLNAIEGHRGEVRLRPPYPAVEGLFGKPTIVNNVETLVNVPWIMKHGAEAYLDLGTSTSPGTKAICLNRGFARPGIVEVEFGRTLRDVIEKDGGGGAMGRNLEAVILGGPMGSLVLPEEWDVRIDYRAMAERSIQLGHGGIVAIPEGSDFSRLFTHWIEFMAEESCGKCVPCRLGSAKALGLARKGPRAADRETFKRLFEIVSKGSLCAFGQATPLPIRKMIDRFGDRIFR